MAPAPLLLLQDIRVTLGTTALLHNAALGIAPGERLALVGRNGSGKSTLLKIAAGLIPADGGTRFVQPGTTVRYLPQEPDLSGYPDTLAYVEAGLGPSDDPYRARYLLEQLGMTGTEDPKVLSGGEARRAALARILAPSPDVLLLDEPTNHLDLPAIEWLESELRSMRSAMVIISHDRRFLQNLSRAMVWLDRGMARRVERGFADFEIWRDEVLEQEERDAHKLDRQIVREEDWLRYGVTARRKRNVRRLADLHALRQKRRDRVMAQGRVKATAMEGDGSGSLVIAAENISKAFDGKTPVVRDFTTNIMRGDRVGIVGPNGAGKSVLLSMLTGSLTPDTGTVTLGTALNMVVLDQKRESLDPGMTLADALTSGHGDIVQVGNSTKHVIGYMKDFLFLPEQARAPVHVLSGGERGRLMLARALATPSNLLVLDEPTNDLDMETLDLLQEVLADYSGTVLIVSHDRDFLDRVTTSVIAAEGDGVWQEYAGGYSDLIAQRGFGVQARAAAVAEKKIASDTPRAEKAAPARKRMSFKDKHALERLPAEMEKLQTEITRLHALLADPQLYQRDPKAFASHSTAMTEAEAKLHVMEEEWLRLEMLREETGE